MFDTEIASVGSSSGERPPNPERVLTAAEWDSLESSEDVELAYQLTMEAEVGPVDDRGLHVLPRDLETIPPGIFHTAILSTVDVSLLSGFDLVRYVQASDRQASHANAGLYRGIGELAYADEIYTNRRSSHLVEFAVEEVQTALGRTRRSADYMLGVALDLRDRLQPVLQALEAGKLDLDRARVFSAETESLEPELIPEVLDQILHKAPELTTGQLRSRLQKLVVAADPQAAEENFEQGVEERRMVTYPNSDHTGTLAIQSADPLEVLAASEYVRQTAMNLKRLPGESRTLDQTCVDVALDLLQGKRIHENGDLVTAPPPRIILQIHADAPTVDAPGYGPILTSQLPSQADSSTIQIEVETLSDLARIEADCPHETPSRRPTKTQAHHVRSVYPTCIFPGCRRPAIRCDLDHRKPWHQGGKTSCKNLAPLCRHHHTCKDQSNWKLERLPDGAHRWTSPLGHTYTRGPP